MGDNLQWTYLSFGGEGVVLILLSKESGILSGGVACTVSVQKRLFLG